MVENNNWKEVLQRGLERVLPTLDFNKMGSTGTNLTHEQFDTILSIFRSKLICHCLDKSFWVFTTRNVERGITVELVEGRCYTMKWFDLDLSE